ncbi:MAG: hypothetical protein NWF00_01845 [Candidatus Bathyarchaeota archaeon]|nr:hypothetical protein [Candidatus Bathyarchaeota archaeon]
MNAKKQLEDRIRGWIPKEASINVTQARPEKFWSANHAAILIVAGLTIAFPFAVYFLPSNIFPYFMIAFITLMIGSGLVVMAGALRFWGKIAVAAIIFSIILGFIAGLALH